jgi:hypothetical protein
VADKAAIQAADDTRAEVDVARAEAEQAQRNVLG